MEVSRRGGDRASEDLDPPSRCIVKETLRDFFLERLYGLLPASMLDWPGRISSVLFVSGCNFRCPYCHNPELVEPQEEGGFYWSELEAFLREREGWLDGVVITGGEPTLYQDLPELCRRLKKAGLGVKLDTNGSRPEVLRCLLEKGLVDFVAMDLKTSLERYPLVVRRPFPVDLLAKRISESIRLILEWGGEHEFRCTLAPGLVEEEDLKALAAIAQGGKKLVLQAFRGEKTLDPDWRGREGYPPEKLWEWARRLSSYVPVEVRGV